MTLRQIKQMLETTGYKVSYRSFPRSETPLNPPFITYLTPNSSNISADNKAHVKVTALEIELYTVNKNPTAEATLETVLDNANIFYDKSEIYIDSEQMYQITYECEVLA